MQYIDAYYMSIKLEAQLAARRAEQASARAEFVPAPQRPILVRLAAALATLGMTFGLPVA
jgi:hypothetical protein